MHIYIYAASFDGTLYTRTTVIHCILQQAVQHQTMRGSILHEVLVHMLLYIKRKISHYVATD